MPLCRSALSSLMQQMIDTVSERLSAVMKSGILCIIPEGNDNLLCGSCCHH
jgi:hypothetical protein